MRSEDLPALACIYMRAFADPELKENWSLDSALALLSHWFAKQADLAFVAEVDGSLAGAFITGVRPWWDGNHLVDGELFVDPQFQSLGLAKALIKAVLLRAEELYKPVLWETYTFREQSFPLTWYKQLGFDEIDEWVMIRADMKKVFARLNLLA